MPKIFKQDSLNFEEDSGAIDKFKLHTVMPRLSQIVDSKHMVFDLRLLNPGQYSFPYHFHRNAEELMLILSGSMTLRTEEGFQIISKGDLVFFEMGATGVHQFYNHEPTPCTYLDIRTTIGIDVCEYPDSGKINIVPYNEIFEKHSTVGYFQGEEEIDWIWDNLNRNK